MEKTAPESRDRPTALYPILVEVSLTRKDDERSEDIETEKFFGGYVRIAPQSEGLNLRLAHCEFNAGEALPAKPDKSDKSEEEDLVVFELKASYIVALRPNASQLSEQEAENAFSALAKVSAWSLFRSLYAQVTSQANVDMPALPPDPEFIVGSSGDDEEN